MTTLNEKYVVDARGRPVQVILDVDTFRRLLEELDMAEDIRAYDEAKASPTPVIPFDQAITEIEGRRRPRSKRSR